MAFDESRTYKVPNGFIDMDALVKDTVNFLENKKKIEKVQYIKYEDGYLIQAKDPIFSVKWLLGLNQVIQFQLILNNDSLTVKIGSGELLADAVGKAIGSMVKMSIKSAVFIPLTMPAIVGQAKQLLLLFELYKFIEKYVTNPKIAIDFLKSNIDNIVNDKFIFRVDDVFTLTGRGIVASGKVETGSINVNDEVCIIKSSGKMKQCYITGIEKFKGKIETANQGDGVWLDLSITIPREVEKGDIICTLDAIETSKRFVAGIHPLTKNQGGRHVPLVAGFRGQFDMSAGNVVIDGTIKTGDKDNIMVMSGEAKFIVVELSEPCSIYKGMEFKILDNGNVRAHGVVDENLDKEDVVADSRVAVSFYADIEVHDVSGLEDPIISGVYYTFNFGSQILEGIMEFPVDRHGGLFHGDKDVVMIKLAKPVNISKGTKFSVLENNVEKATGVTSDFADE